MFRDMGSSDDVGIDKSVTDYKSTRKSTQSFLSDNAQYKNDDESFLKSFVDSSSSQQRFMHPTTDSEHLKTNNMLTNSLQNADMATPERFDFPQTIFNRTANESASETSINIANLKADLAGLYKDENFKREEHNHSRRNLQEAWDKLVQLRTHISNFKSAIEEATIEDVSLQARKGSWTAVNLSFSASSEIPLTAESAIRLGDAHGIREKVRLKEGLQKKISQVEEFLTDLRSQLAHHSSELTKISKTADRILVYDTISSSMTIRQAVITVSKQLEDTEREYLTLRDELEEVEVDLASLLERSRCNDSLNSAMAGKLSSNDSYSDANHAILGATTTVSSEDLSNVVSAALNGEDGSNKYALSREIMKRKVSSESVKNVRCEFSLHEVLSGYARVTRLNGEEPKAYRNRLEKRLFSLLVLDQQLQEELLVKTEDVRKARDQLREVEVMRLRVELQVTNVEGSLRQLLKDTPDASNRIESNMNTSPIRSPYPTIQQGLSSATSALALFDRDFNVASDEGAKKGPIPGSMYSPRISPNWSNCHSPLHSPKVFGTAQSEEYLYSIAQLTAHSGIKTPGIRGETVLRKDSGSDMDDIQRERIEEAARMLKRDLSAMPKADVYITVKNDPYKDPFRYEPTSLQDDYTSDTATEPLDAEHTQQSKTGQKVHSPLPALTNSKGFLEEKSSSEACGSNPRQALERARDLISRLECEREQSYTDSEGYSERNGGHDTPSSSWGDKDMEGRESREGMEVREDRGFDLRESRSSSPLHGVQLSVRSLSPRSTGRGRSRSPWDGRRVSRIPAPIRCYRSPDGRMSSEKVGESLSLTNSAHRMPSSDPRQDSCDVSHLHHSQATSVSSTTVSSPPAFPCSPAPSLTELSLQQLSKCQAKLVQALKTEILNHETGIAVDQDGNSLGVVDILVISARNLPEMKKLTHSVDAFVEVELIGADGTALNRRSAFEGASRTSVQWNNIYPEWRDKLHISPVEDLSELLLISLKDATKNGESETIGQCILPLSKLLDQQAHTFWINLEPPSETRKSARNRVKLPANCAVRIEAKLTYCRRVLLQQKFDLISMRLREMKMTGAFELPIAPSRFSTEDIVREAHRVRCAGGGRSLRIDKSKGISSPISEDGRRTPRSERSGWEESSGSGAQTLSSKHKAIKEQLYTVRGVYHLSREHQPPIEIPRTPKRPGSGPRLKQDSPASTPGRCSNTANTTSSRVNSKLCDVGQEMRSSFSTTCNTSAAANSLSTSSSNSTTRSDTGSVTSKKTVVKYIQCAQTPPSKEKKRTSHDEQETVPRSDLPSPDLSIFKSSRARLALKKSNRISTVKMKPSSAFGATCWTAPSYPIIAAAHGSPL